MRRAPRPALDNLDQTIAVSNTLTISSRTVLETRAQFAHSRSAGAADRSDRAGGGDHRRRLLRHELEQSDRPRQPRCTRSSTTSRTRRARTRSGSVSTSSTTTTASPSRARCAAAYAFSSLANFLARHLQQCRLHADVRCVEVSQTNPNLGVYAQDEWKLQSNAHAEPRSSLRPSVPRDDRHR